MLLAKEKKIKKKREGGGMEWRKTIFIGGEGS